MNTKRPITLLALVVFWLGLPLLGACQSSEPRSTVQSSPLRVCYSSLAATQIPVLYAREKGIFAAQGLEVELFYFESGTDAVTAMIAGEIDICQVAGSSVVNAVVAGQDLVILAGLINTYVYSFLVTPEIVVPEDLRDKAVAISRIGSSSDTAIRVALESMGLVPDEDVAVLAVGDQSVRLAAMESGQIAGTVVSIPESTRGIQHGFHELLNMSALNAPFQHTAIATTRTFLEAERDQTAAFMQALLISIARMKEDRSGTMGVIAQYLQLDPATDQDLIRAAYDEIILVYLPERPYPTLDGIQVLLDELVANNPAAADFTPEQLVDLEVLEEALKSIGEPQENQ
ncbi:MAG: ABC transporter substrate-binding protein [Anaerolineales bacterium]|nr:MAG: ABC transporter substrate-binding protein [Anaerolineales bacterium]